MEFVPRHAEDGDLPAIREHHRVLEVLAAHVGVRLQLIEGQRLRVRVMPTSSKLPASAIGGMANSVPSAFVAGSSVSSCRPLAIRVPTATGARSSWCAGGAFANLRASFGVIPLRDAVGREVDVEIHLQVAHPADQGVDLAGRQPRIVAEFQAVRGIRRSRGHASCGDLRSDGARQGPRGGIVQQGPIRGDLPGR